MIRVRLFLQFLCGPLAKGQALPLVGHLTSLLGSPLFEEHAMTACVHLYGSHKNTLPQSFVDPRGLVEAGDQNRHQDVVEFKRSGTDSFTRHHELGTCTEWKLSLNETNGICNLSHSESTVMRPTIAVAGKMRSQVSKVRRGPSKILDKPGSMVKRIPLDKGGIVGKAVPPSNDVIQVCVGLSSDIGKKAIVLGVDSHLVRKGLGPLNVLLVPSHDHLHV